MTWTIRPAVREDTPLIIGIAGPTKSGKTYSALRVAMGLANSGKIVMLNAEGKRGHQYAGKFKYEACDITSPFSPDRYEDAVSYIAKLSPSVLIIDSASHMHDGPGGLLEWHDKELDRMAGQDENKRHRSTWTAWIKPKAAENKFIYTMLGLSCPVILCFRAKEKLQIVTGQEPKNLGWQPIAGDRITFETLFTLVLPPHSKGVPDPKLSELRDPFETLIPFDRPIDERLGQKLAEWAKGDKQDDPARKVALEAIGQAIAAWFPGQSEAEQAAKGRVIRALFKKSWREVEASQPIEDLEAVMLGGDDSRLNKACADQKAAMVA